MRRKSQQLGQPGFLGVLAGDPGNIRVVIRGHGHEATQSGIRADSYRNAPAIAEGLAQRANCVVLTLAGRPGSQFPGHSLAYADGLGRGVGGIWTVTATDSPASAGPGSVPV